MKKSIIVVILVILIVSVGLFFKSQSSYEVVKQAEIGTKNEKQDIVDEKWKKKDDEYQRTSEEVAIDKRIKKQREKNEKTYRETGIVGNIGQGKGYLPKRTMGELEKVNAAMKEYMNERPEIYPEFEKNGEFTINLTRDLRFDELIWGTPKEERKGLIANHKDEDMIVMECKRLDGEYDELFLVKNPETGIWEVQFVGAYYAFREAIQ